MSIENETTTKTGAGMQQQQPVVLLTRAELALALKVSISTLDRMLADQEITPVRLRGKLVRFYLPDVMKELRSRAGTSKRGVTRRV
jgi:excisionase family DNA binding protein